MKPAPLKLLLWSACLLAPTCWLVSSAAAQNAPTDPRQQPAQQKPSEANPFPDDNANVPVMPSKGVPVLPPGTYTGDATPPARARVLSDEQDPVRSPDDASSASSGATDELTSTSSDSRAGLDKIAPDSDDDDQPQGRKHRKTAAPVPEHKETAKEDIEVGQYYLETKNWKAAQSRFQSAMVLSPDEPDVYWGLAESARHLGQLAQARGYYQKVAEYDPDSKHGKEAMKALKEPEIANAKTATPPQ